jgi:signal peptidase
MFKKIAKVFNIAFFTIIIGLIAFIAYSAITNTNKKNNFSLFGYSVYTVLTASMVPEFDINSLILVKEVPEEKLKVGDIITFYPAEDNVTVLTHRITRIESQDGLPVYYTQGDANNVEDPNPVKYSSIIGVTIFWLDKLGGYLLKLRTPAGIAWIVGITVFLLLLTHVVETANKKKKKKRKKKRSAASRARAAAAKAAGDPSQAPPRKPAAKKKAPSDPAKRPKAASNGARPKASAKAGADAAKPKPAKPKAAVAKTRTVKDAPGKTGVKAVKTQAKTGVKKTKVESA